MLSIVIPVRNRAEQIKRTLDSVLKQTYRPLHVILVDNDSNDGTWEVLRDWQRLYASKDFTIELASESRLGACPSRNTGLKMVKSQWVMFFDSDDIMAPEHCARAMAGANHNPKAQIVGWPIMLQPLKGKKKIKPCVNEDMWYQCVLHGSLATQRYMAKTQLVRDAGGWRNDVLVWNDIELGVRLLNKLDSRGQFVTLGSVATVTQIAQPISLTGTNYSHNGPLLEHSLDCIEASLSADKKWIVDLKRAVLASLYSREKNRQQGRALMGKIQPDKRWYGVIYRFVYAFSSLGIPGMSRLVRPLFPR